MFVYRAGLRLRQRNPRATYIFMNLGYCRTWLELTREYQ